MSAALVSAIVAAAAVLVSAVMQYLTLQGARTNTALTVETTQRTTRLTALASSTAQWEQGLREDLAEFATLTYDVESGYKFAMAQNKPWPGDKMEIVNRVDVLFNRIRLRLDETREADAQVTAAMQTLMDSSSRDLWIDRRDALVRAAVAAFREHWMAVFSET